MINVSWETLRKLNSLGVHEAVRLTIDKKYEEAFWMESYYSLLNVVRAFGKDKESIHLIGNYSYSSAPDGIYQVFSVDGLDCLFAMTNTSYRVEDKRGCKD